MVDWMTVKLTDKEIERIWEGVDKSQDCWTTWRSPSFDYPRITIRRLGRNILMSRLIWVLENGPIEDGLHILHTCDNTRCINPSHLFLGTHGENMADKAKKGRVKRGTQTKGSKHHWSKLTEGEVLEMRADYDAGMKMKEISDKFATPLQTVFNIINRKSWKHI